MLSNGPPRLRHIVVVGGGATGWMAAAALAAVIRPGGTRVTLIDDVPEEDGVVTTRPAIKDLHAVLGVDEDEMLAAAGGTMRLGTRFVDGDVPLGGFVHAFGGFGLDVGGVPLYQVWLRARAGGQPIELDDYNLAGLAMRLGRFAPPAADKRTMIDHGYQLDRPRYADFLRDLAQTRGVDRRMGTCLQVRRDGGSVASVSLHDGTSIEGDFFVDCRATGVELIDGGREDWNALFPFMASVEAHTGASDLPPFDTVTAMPGGWLHRVNLQHRTSYRLSHSGAADGLQALLAVVAEPRLGPVRRSAISAGRRVRCWDANCVALGSAAAVVDPVAASDLDLAAAGIIALLGLLPDIGDSVAEAQAFNQSIDRHVTAHRDFALLHRMTIIDGEPRIVGLARSDIPPSLLHRIALFAGRGRLPDDGAGGITAPEWLGVLLGRGVFPRSWDVRADLVDAGHAADTFLRLAGLFRQSAETMPQHAHYIARHCPAAMEP